MHEDEYIIVVRDAYEPLTETEAMLTFFGHTHIQGGFAVDGEEWLTLRPLYKTSDTAEAFTFPMKKTAKYLINPGSARQPRDGDWRAACCIFDSEKHQIQFLRIPYDVKATQKKILESQPAGSAGVETWRRPVEHLTASAEDMEMIWFLDLVSDLFCAILDWTQRSQLFKASRRRKRPS